MLSSQKCNVTNHGFALKVSVNVSMLLRIIVGHRHMFDGCIYPHPAPPQKHLTYTLEYNILY